MARRAGSALQRLDQQARKLERQARGPSVPALIAEEGARSHSYGSRSVFGWEPPPADEQQFASNIARGRNCQAIWASARFALPVFRSRS